MKTTLTIAAIMMITLTFGLAFAGAEYTDQRAVPFETDGDHLGAVMQSTVKGSRSIDPLLGLMRTIPFESYPEHLASTDTGAAGAAAGGMRTDTDRGSRIYDDLLGAKQPVPFE